MDEDTIVSDGPSEQIYIGSDIVWNMHSKQGVFLLSYLSDSSIKCNKVINLNVIFDPDEGDITFKIE